MSSIRMFDVRSLLVWAVLVILIISLEAVSAQTGIGSSVSSGASSGSSGSSVISGSSSGGDSGGSSSSAVVFNGGCIAPVTFSGLVFPLTFAVDESAFTPATQSVGDVISQLVIQDLSIAGTSISCNSIAPFGGLQPQSVRTMSTPIRIFRLSEYKTLQASSAVLMIIKLELFHINNANDPYTLTAYYQHLLSDLRSTSSYITTHMPSSLQFINATSPPLFACYTTATLVQYMPSCTTSTGAITPITTQTSTASSSSSSSSSSFPTGAIVGIAIGGAVIICFVIGLMVYCCFRSMKSSQLKSQSDAAAIASQMTVSIGPKQLPQTHTVVLSPSNATDVYSNPYPSPTDMSAQSNGVEMAAMAAPVAVGAAAVTSASPRSDTHYASSSPVPPSGRASPDVDGLGTAPPVNAVTVAFDDEWPDADSDDETQDVSQVEGNRRKVETDAVEEVLPPVGGHTLTIHQ